MDASTPTDLDPELQAELAGPGLRRLPAAVSDVERLRASVSRHRLRHLDSLNDTALSFMSLEQMLSELLERIRATLAVDTAAVLLLDEDRGVLVARAARGLEEEVRQGVQVPLARGFAGRVAAGRRPIVIEDLSRADVVNPILRQKGIRSMLGVPLQAQGRVIGVMHIGTLRRRLFDRDDVTLLQLAADRAALAIDDARLLEQRAATQIMQRTLLPDALPHVPGLRFSAKYLPAGTGVKIGGDWYDVFPLTSGKVALVIGDVVGRGVLAASVMAEIRTALRAYLAEGHRLGRVMELLNELLIAMGRERSATVAIFELDLDRSELTGVSAGHLPTLSVAPDGEPRFLELPSGLPLGIRSGQHYREGHHPFAPGSALLLYTDGLVERRGESIDVGLERLREAAARALTDGDSSFADDVYRALVQEASVDDDVALLAIESLPLEAVLDLELEAKASVLADLRGAVGRWLAAGGAGPQDLFDIVLATSEAAANAIEHAYGARRESFRVRCERDGANVRVAVSDRGNWRHAQPYGRGRGLSMMQALMDNVEVSRGEPDGTGSVVRMSKRLATGSS
jgi:serine phosphatase RsbU (regulator of sigma subunit)/anti-sigma regulatory factor (Ser/Thr protein kinase)